MSRPHHFMAKNKATVILYNKIVILGKISGLLLKIELHGPPNYLWWSYLSPYTSVFFQILIDHTQVPSFSADTSVVYSQMSSLACF